MPDDQINTGFLKTILEKFIDIGQEQIKETKNLKDSIERMINIVNGKPCILQQAVDKCQHCAIMQTEKERNKTSEWFGLMLKTVLILAGISSTLVLYKYIFLK